MVSPLFKIKRKEGLYISKQRSPVLLIQAYSDPLQWTFIMKMKAFLGWNNLELIVAVINFHMLSFTVYSVLYCSDEHYQFTF